MTFTTILLILAVSALGGYFFGIAYAAFMLAMLGVFWLAAWALTKRLLGEKMAKFAAFVGVLFAALILFEISMRSSYLTGISWEFAQRKGKVQVSKFMAPQTPVLAEEALLTLQFVGETVEGLAIQGQVRDLLARYQMGMIKPDEYYKEKEKLIAEYKRQKKAKEELNRILGLQTEATERRLNPAGCPLVPEKCPSCQAARNQNHIPDRGRGTVITESAPVKACWTGFSILPNDYLEGGATIKPECKIWRQSPNQAPVATGPAEFHRTGERVFRFMVRPEEEKNSCVVQIITPSEVEGGYARTRR